VITPRRPGEPDGQADLPDTLVIHAAGCHFAVAVIGSGPEHGEAVAAALTQPGTTATEPEWRAAS
jgi:hypothetical protein